ncbi:hypothetical protein DPMN_166226 [Dreissena polymorpha]|uniref:F5/8 type C domain-containing protein n=1 Tax=Dreissena polymorpha TaxID=45954 RepID=A0A9D4F153_DREPO|nr:hypothetical protein DPMN_166226 [Dreissena polymorpha]
MKCPEAVTIWRVALKTRAINGKNITEWDVSGSKDGKTFTPLLTSGSKDGKTFTPQLTSGSNGEKTFTPQLTTKLSGSAIAPSFFDISTTYAYQYYGLN